MSLDQEVGMLQGQVKSLTDSQEKLEDAVDKLTAAVNALTLTVQTTIAEGKGGWKVITILASVSVTFGSLIGWFAAHIKV